nr:RRXRR domain-containing protein [Alicyclobacillus fructus]
MVTWVARLRRLAPISHLSMELVRFDTQKLQNPEIHGVEYQQGTLFGYEVREYLLERWDHARRSRRSDRGIRSEPGSREIDQAPSPEAR